MNNGYDLGLVTIVKLKATGEYLAFSTDERLEEYMQKHGFLEDDYDITGWGFMDTPFPPSRNLKRNKYE